MRCIFKYLLCLFLFIFVITKVEALSVDKSDISIDAGSTDKIDLYANVENASKVEFNLTFSTYDIRAEFIKGDGFTEETPSGIKHILTFDEAKSGKILLGTINIFTANNPKDLIGTININTATAYDEEGNITNLNSQTINIKVNKEEEVKVEPNNDEPVKKEEKKEEKTDTDNNLLDKIESNIVKIKLEKDKFIYNITINEDIEELDLKPVAKDSNTEINIETQKIKELTDNKLIIKTKNNDIEQEYTINIKIKKNNNNNDLIKIDNSKFKSNNNYKSKWRVLAIIFAVLTVISAIIFAKKK